MTQHRIVFMGTPAFATPVLEALCDRPDLYDVVAAVCQPDRPQGRGRKLAACPVKIFAAARGIPVLQPTKLKSPETQAALRALRPTFFIVAAYGRILPPAMLAIPTHGSINVHASLLPRFRGASPIAHAILAGDRDAGVCIMQMEEGLDTGGVYHRHVVPIGPEDTCGSLTIKLAHAGADALREILPDIAAGKSHPTPQDAAGTTYAPMLVKEAGHLDWQQPAEALARQVRAFDPWPGCYTMMPQGRLAVEAAHVDSDTHGPAGKVLVASNKGVCIACGSGALWLDRVKPQGRKSMPAAAWAAGRQVQVGDMLGAAQV